MRNEKIDDFTHKRLSEIYIAFVSEDLSFLSYMFCVFIQALEKYGVVKGSYIGIKRILRCHPWNPGGYDPLK